MTNRRKSDRQREHQANERTFLAWMRTSVSLIGFGLAIARFGLFLRQSELTTGQVTQNYLFDAQVLGISLVILGIVVVLLAALRHNRVFRQIEQENYRPNRLMIWLVTFVIALLGTLSLPLLWGGNNLPATPKKELSLQIELFYDVN